MARSRKAKLRCKRITFVMNESEYKALERYCKRYKVTNRSALIRQTLIKSILKRFSNDTPTLFD